MYQATILILGFLPWLILAITSKFTHKTNVISPLKILAWTFLIGYTLKSLYLTYAVGNDAPFKTRRLSLEIIPLGQLCILIATACLVLGYFMFFRFPKHYRLPSLASRIGLRWVYIPFFSLSLGLMIIYFYQMGLGQQILSGQFRTEKFYVNEETGVRSTLGFLTVGSDFLVIAALFFALASEKLKPYNLHILAITFVSFCFMMVGRRNGVMIPIVLALLVLPSRIKLFPQSNYTSIFDLLRKWRVFVIIGAILLSLTFVSQVRGAHTEVGVAELNFGDAFAATAEHTLEGAYFLDPAKTAAIIDHTAKNKSFLMGDSFTNIIYTPIPRVMWPEKPDIKIGPYVAQQILGYYNRSGVPPGGIGELYLNFGWTGVILGSFFLGTLMAWLHKNALSAANPAIGCIKYSVYMMCIIIFLTTEFSGAILSLIRYSIALFICEMFWAKRLDWNLYNRRNSEPIYI